MTTPAPQIQEPVFLKNLVLNVISPNILFFSLAIIPLLIVISTISLRTTFTSFYKAKIVLIKTCFFIMASVFTFTFFIVLSRIQSSEPLIDSKNILFSPVFVIGTVALVVLITLIAIRTKKYTQFEHAFILTSSFLSLYLFYFYISIFGISQLTLYLLIFIFLINTGIHILFLVHSNNNVDFIRSFPIESEHVSDTLEGIRQFTLFYLKIQDYAIATLSNPKINSLGAFINKFPKRYPEAAHYAEEIITNHFETYMQDFECSFLSVLIKKKMFSDRSQQIRKEFEDILLEHQAVIFSNFGDEIYELEELFLQLFFEKFLLSYREEYNIQLEKFSNLTPSETIFTPEKLEENVESFKRCYLNFYKFPKYESSFKSPLFFYKSVLDGVRGKTSCCNFFPTFLSDFVDIVRLIKEVRSIPDLTNLKHLQTSLDQRLKNFKEESNSPYKQLLDKLGKSKK